MTAVSLDRDPPAWAASLARHRAGLRKLIRSLLEEEAGTPMWALDALLAAIPEPERERALSVLRFADGEVYADGSKCEPAIGDAIDAVIWHYERHVAAAYQHGPHLGRWQDATRVPTVEEQADALLADLAAIPVTVVEIGGAS